MPAHKTIDVTEETKLRWPDGIDRTRIKDRKRQPAWKQSRTEYFKALVEELGRMKAASILISRHESEQLDPGVAVWFSLKTEDFSWQQILGLDNPAPTMAEIDEVFRDRARKCHPDSPDGGDPALFKKLNEARIQAKAWITGTHGHRHEYVMAIDQYNEARLNMQALKLAFTYIRGLQRVGAPAILSQTLGAFRAKLTAASGGAA
ncbi:MAG TPA: J domain-containing protein [Acidobacteriaceae bacterium]|jgi:hypothetical protein|nr:J domain-containing protein [Acidobacteriaceae bacterium]